MSISFVLKRGSYQEQFECLNCYTTFYDDHGNPIHGWSWCPVCGIKWEGALLFRDKKWRRFYVEHDLKEKRTPRKVWVLEKRWHGFEGEVEEWEKETRTWDPSERKWILARYRTEIYRQRHSRKCGSLYYEYRLVRKTLTIF